MLLEVLNGVDKAGPGDGLTLLAAAGATVSLRWSGVDATNSVLVLHTEQGELARRTVNTPEGEFKFPALTDAAFVRAELRDGVGKMLAFTNPIWIRVQHQNNWVRRDDRFH